MLDTQWSQSLFGRFAQIATRFKSMHTADIEADNVCVCHNHITQCSYLGIAQFAFCTTHKVNNCAGCFISLILVRPSEVIVVWYSWEPHKEQSFQNLWWDPLSRALSIIKKWRHLDTNRDKPPIEIIFSVVFVFNKSQKCVIPDSLTSQPINKWSINRTQTVVNETHSPIESFPAQCLSSSNDTKQQHHSPGCEFLEKFDHTAESSWNHTLALTIQNNPLHFCVHLQKLTQCDCPFVMNVIAWLGSKELFTVCCNI